MNGYNLATGETMSEHEPTKKDRIFFRGDVGGRIQWEVDTVTWKFWIVKLPLFFAEAPQDILDETLEWVRENAKRKHRGEAGLPMPESVKEWKNSPEIVGFRKARGYVPTDRKEEAQ